MKCEVCNKEFEEQYFDVSQNKCILHSTKNDTSEYENFDLQLFSYLEHNKHDDMCKFKDIHFPSNYPITQNLNAHYTFESKEELENPKPVHLYFDKCHFINSLILDNPFFILKFEKCVFEKQYEHIISNETKFIKCTFDEYVYQNISEDKTKISNFLFFDCGFTSINFTGAHFTEKLFKFTSQNEYYKITELNLINCEFDKDIIFNSTREEGYSTHFKITSLDFSESTFKGKVKIQFCEIENAIFYNTKFKDLADFYQSKFKKVDFERTDFEKISVFSETEFLCNVDFKYTKFLGKSIFRDTTITGILNLRNSIFDDEANFLDITSKTRDKDTETKEFIGEVNNIQVANRETARVIKNFYDTNNNIIEANKFYALEMEEREKELQQNKTKSFTSFIEWLVFKAHKVSSNHSQDWLLTLLWMLAITFVFEVLRKNTYCSNDMILLFLLTNASLILLGILFICILPLSLKWYLCLVSVSIPFLTRITFEDFANLINPFSIMTGGEKLTFSMLIYKIIIAYLIYQFIISVRQNTRRK